MLWSKAEKGALPRDAPAEVEVADLAGLALDIAAWGARGPGDLAFLTPPNPGAYAEATATQLMNVEEYVAAVATVQDPRVPAGWEGLP